MFKDFKETMVWIVIKTQGDMETKDYNTKRYNRTKNVGRQNGKHPGRPHQQSKTTEEKAVSNKIGLRIPPNSRG